jgi:NAD+ diphosphatase
MIDPHELLLFAFAEGDLVLTEAGAVPTAGAFSAHIDLTGVHQIGEYQGRPSVTIALGTAEPPPGMRRIGLRAVFGELGEEAFVVAARAAQVIEWDRSHRFCGRCARPTELMPNERGRRCPVCELVQYPRISPVIMVLVLRGRQILLARNARFPAGMYSALAGFCEAGETLEETLVREVREEVGIEVKDFKYFSSQSWPFPHSLMIAFTAHYAGGELRPDGVEIEDARWFDLADVPHLPPGISIASRLIRATVAELTALEANEQKTQ